MDIPQPFEIFSPSLVRRRVLFAVSLVDPVSGARLSEGLKVRATGLNRAPIINLSGHFVWLVEEMPPPLPITLEIKPATPLFMAETVQLELPPDLENAPEASRLVKRFLRPTPTYPFPDTTILVRGSLRESSASGAAAVINAQAQLEWLDGDTTPPRWRRSHASIPVDANGAVVAALAAPADARPDIATPGSVLHARIRFERAGVARQTQAFDLMSKPADTAPVERVRNTWTLKNTLAWNELEAA